MLNLLPRDILLLIYDRLNVNNIINLARTSKNTYNAYKIFIKYFRKEKTSKNTLIFPYQSKLIEKIVKKVTTDQKCRFMCRADMSAGKTLIGLESAMRLLKIDKSMIIGIIVPANVIGVWMLELKKHYKTPNKVKERTVLFYDSKRKGDVDIIKTGLNINPNLLLGKIIVMTPTSKRYNEILVLSQCIIIDEAHKQEKAYKHILEIYDNTPIVLLSATESKSKKITDVENVKISKDYFPNISYNYILEKKESETYATLIKLLNESTHKYIGLVFSSINITFEFINLYKNQLNKELFDFTSRGVTHYKNFVLNGGILFSTMKVIAEGNNLNTISEIYILNTFGSKIYTIHQCIGRFMRQSNINNELIVNFINCDFKSNIRCKLAATEYHNLNIKSENSFNLVLKYLDSKNVDISSLSDMEIILCFTNLDSFDISNLDTINIDMVKNIDINILLRCMII